MLYRFADNLRAGAFAPARKLLANLYNIYHCCVYSEKLLTMDRGTVHLHLPAYEDGTECSETSAYKIQTPGNYPEESTKHSEHGESLKSRI